MPRARANPELSDILAHCELFISLSHADCELIAGRCEQRLIKAGQVLLAEGDVGEEMYVLIEGALEVFKRAGGEEVILQRIDTRGAHIGEGALVESGDDIRRASVRSLSDSHVLVVPKDALLLAMQLSPAIEEHISIVHHRQNRQLSLVEQSVMYRAMALFDQEHGWSRAEHFEPGEVIVAEGDPPTAVYVVRSGTVKRVRVEDGEEIALSMLHEGHTFGGLAVLEDRPHSAAAIAETAVELVTFDREQFLQATATLPELHEYLGAVKRVYAMTGGLATLFDGEFRGQPALVTVVRLDDGREVIVNHVIDRAIYSASLEIPPDAEVEDFIYRDDQREILRILTLFDGELARVHAEGPWDELDRLHALLLDHARLEREALERFSDSGHLLGPSPAHLAAGPDAILCQCLGLTRRAIEETMVHGVETLDDLSRETGATTVCGACTVAVAALLASTGQSVVLTEEITVAPDTRSFRFTPCGQGADDESEPQPLRSALPGQHVVVSAEIDGAWVQRPYTITSPAQCTQWREITVKREDHGFLSNWLFKQPQAPRLKLSHPRGDFWIDPELGETVVCLVAGIGMTPALALARSIDEARSEQTLHIDYSARTQVNFAYRDELEELAARHPNIHVVCRATGGRQHLDAETVQTIHTKYPRAKYLVCGPQNYMQAVQEMLREAGVKPARVQVEVFTAVGHAPLDTAPEHLRRVHQLQLIVTLGLCAFYLLQSAFAWGLPAIAALQELAAYRVATGSALLAFIAHQWYLPYLRLMGARAARFKVPAGGLAGMPAEVKTPVAPAAPAKAPAARFNQLLAPSALPWHRHLGVLAPVLLYLHSVSLGIAYTFVLSLLFVLNTMIGAVDKTWLRNFEQRERFQRIWLLLHVPSACLVTVLAVIHMVYALAYK